jgi:hypothetical protein
MKNAMGTELTPAQAALVEAYHKILATLKDHGDTLAPFEERNALKAAAALWQVLNGLDLDPPHLYDVGA